MTNVISRSSVAVPANDEIGAAQLLSHGALHGSGPQGSEQKPPHSVRPSLRQSVMQHPGVAIALAVVDYLFFWIAVGISGALAWLLNTEIWNRSYQAFSPETLQNRLIFCFYLSVGLCGWLAATGTYTSRRPFEEDIKRLTGALFTMLIVDGFVEFAAKQQFSRLWVVMLWPCAGIMMPLGRMMVRHVLDALGVWRIGAAVFGSGERYASVVEAMEKQKYVGYYVAYHSALSSHPELPLSNLAAKFAHDMALRRAETAILVPSAEEIPRIDRVIDALNLRLKPYILVPPVQRLSFAGLTVQSTLTSDAILMSSRQGLISPVRRTLKRAFDIIISASLLVFLAPALLLIALAVATSGFPILYGHERIGLGRKPFRCLKFRTMVVNSDEVLARLLATDPERAREWGQNFKLSDDPRITRVGKFLRESSLDELPQLINVLRGEMSLVGPRPVVAKEIKLYYGEDAFYYELVRPGVTGLWQVSGRSQTSYARRVFLDSCYVRNWSLWTDLMILFSTIPSVLARDGAQ